VILTLTPKQQAFADYYLELGNATEASIKAGYSKENAGNNADKLLKNTKIKAYIDERLEEINSERIASIDEVMRFYTSVLRGEEKDQFGLDASLTDRIKAGQELIKRLSVGGYNDNKPKEEDPLSKALKEEAERMNNGSLS
jgi:phage terminase small subunit